MDKRALFFVAYIFFNAVQANYAPIVNTAIGTIRGVRSDDGKYNMYMGIPYGRVNESNPFGPPLPYPAFDEIFEANDDSSMCPQVEEFNNTIVGDLECLRLNVYTPSYVNSTSRLPVLVWLHGGGFNFGYYGTFMYGPRYLVRHDVLLVTMNYRLGPYGFMCLDIPEVPGNQGLKDQIMALRWLKAHISAFGGDPDRITLSGNSAGGMAIDMHLLSDHSNERLFERAILQSGTPFVFGYGEPFLDAPIVLARYFEFETDNVYEAIAFLAGIPPVDVMLAHITLGLAISNACIEKSFPGVERYLSTHWVTAPTPGVANMTVMIGVNNDEMGATRDAEGSGLILNAVSLRFNSEHEHFRGMGELVEQFYLGDENMTDVIEDYVNFSSDIQFIYTTYRSLHRYLENNAGNIYFYNFSYVGERNFVRRKTNNLDGPGGARHADEIGYLFEMGFIPEEPNPEDQIMIDKMTTLWTNFVKYGDPTPEVTDLINVRWDPIVPNSPIYSMNIDRQLSVVASPIAQRVTFWDAFYETNRHLERV